MSAVGLLSGLSWYQANAIAAQLRLEGKRCRVLPVGRSNWYVEAK